VLVLVLKDHLEDEPVAEELAARVEPDGVEGVEDLAPDQVDVGTRLVRPEQRQAGPGGARMLERVVEVSISGRMGSRPAVSRSSQSSS